MSAPKLLALVVFEFSGTVRDALRRLGHDAVSCDVLPSETPGPHYRCDAREVLHRRPWDLLIAHPPCTRLTNSGVRWLNERNLWADLDDAAALFRDVLNANVPRIAVENPIPHRYAVERIGATYTQIVQPWWFGHAETKPICLWLKNLPPLVKTADVEAEMQALPASQKHRIHRMPPGPNRWKERSRTYQGFADAMALQWGGDARAVRGAA